MSNPVISIATRLQCVADDLRATKPWLPSQHHIIVTRICAELEHQAERLKPRFVPSPAMAGDAPLMGGHEACPICGGTKACVQCDAEAVDRAKRDQRSIEFAAARS